MAEMTVSRKRAPSFTGGMVMFAGVLLLVAGIWHGIAGFAALMHDTIFLSTPDYVYSLDLTAWGWGHLLLGILVAVIGVAVLKGQWWGRMAGIVVVVLSLIANFLFIPWYPIWSLVIIALDMALIWALASRPEPVD